MGMELLGPIEAVELTFPFDAVVGRQDRSRRRGRIVALVRQRRHREAILQRR